MNIMITMVVTNTTVEIVEKYFREAWEKAPFPSRDFNIKEEYGKREE